MNSYLTTSPPLLKLSIPHPSPPKKKIGPIADRVPWVARRFKLSLLLLLTLAFICFMWFTLRFARVFSKTFLVGFIFPFLHSLTHPLVTFQPSACPSLGSRICFLTNSGRSQFLLLCPASSLVRMMIMRKHVVCLVG